MAKKGKFKLEVLKYNALKLRNSYQLPYKLVYYINQLSPDSPVECVQYLCNMSEHLLRLKGYYKKYPDIERECNALVEKEYLHLLSNRA